MENEVGLLKTQHPLGKTHFCKASLTSKEFLLDRGENYALSEENKSLIEKNITAVYFSLFKCILLKLVFMFSI